MLGGQMFTPAPYRLLGLVAYAAGGTYTTTSVSFVDVDATNLVVTFIAPASGNVLVRLSGVCTGPTGPANLQWALREASSTLTPTAVAVASTAAVTQSVWTSIGLYVTGITPGSHSYKWAWKVSAGTGSLFSDSTDGALIMEVWPAP